jgi:hypothetical protein
MNKTSDPVQALVHASERLAFFDNMGIVFTNYVLRGKTINANGITKALRKFEKVVKEKWPEMCAGEWFFQKDITHSQSAMAVKVFSAQKSTQMMEQHPLFTWTGWGGPSPYSPRSRTTWLESPSPRRAS